VCLASTNPLNPEPPRMAFAAQPLARVQRALVVDPRQRRVPGAPCILIPIGLDHAVSPIGISIQSV
jgi:hypothetical protein